MLYLYLPTFLLPKQWRWRLNYWLKEGFENSDNKINFLDVLVQRFDTSIDTCIYHKPNIPWGPNHWKSHGPIKYKINAASNLMKRAMDIGSNQILRDKGIDEICQKLIELEYPKFAINKARYRATHISTRPPQSEAKEKRFIRSTYVSTKVSNHLTHIARKSKDIDLVPYHPSSAKLSGIFKSEPDDYKENNCVVYSIPCKDCSQVYIGQTKPGYHKKNSTTQVCIKKG